MVSRNELLERLKELNLAQFEEILFRLEIDPAIIPSSFAEQSIRAIRVIRRLQQERDGLERLEKTLAEPAISIVGKQYIGYEIEAQVKRIVDEYTQQPFEGREEEKRRLDEFVTNNPSGVLLVTGAAGFGKSALLSHWQQTRQEDYFIAYHCFSYRSEKTRLVSEAYRHLLKQLYLYYNYNIRNGQFPNDENGMRDILVGMLDKPVSSEGKRLVIILDGLDEADKTFEPFFTRLPAGVFVIASARAESGDEPKYLRNWTDNAQRLHLERLPREAIPKWLGQISELAAYSEDEEFIKSLDETTGGFPLYLRFLIDDLREVVTQNQDVREVLAQTPEGFEGYVEQQLERLDELDLPEQRWQFFALLAVAKGVLEKKDIKTLTQMRDRDLRQLHQSWRVTRWMQITEDKFYAFAHPLLAKTFGDKLGDDAEDALRELIEYCAKWQEHHSAYALRHYAEHLRDVKQWEELYNLLTKFEYIDTKISVLGVHTLIEDYDLDFSPESITTNKKVKFNIENLKLIQGALRLSAHILEQDKTQLLGQLWGRLGRFDVLQQAQHRQTSPWLRPLTPSLTSPDEPLIRTLTGHSGSVWSVAVTSDGEQIISGSQDGTIKIWNLNSGNLERTIPAHNDSVNAVCTDGSYVISGSRDKTLKVWNLKTGELVRTLTGHSKALNATVITPDGSKVISGSDDKTLKIWELKTGKLLHTLDGGFSPVQAVTTVFTKNKKWVVSGSYNDSLRVWNLETGKEEFLLGECDTIWSIAATLDGESVISASQDKTLTIWKVEAWEKEAILRGHSKSVRTVAVTPDGKHIISGSSFDGTIKIWRVGTWMNEATFIGHTASVLAVAVTPDGQKIISASGNSLNSSEYLLKVWHLEKCTKQKNECETTIAHSDSVEVVTFTPDGKEVISVSKDHTLKIWEVGTWKNKATFKGQSKFKCSYGVDWWEIIFQFEADEVKCCFCSTRNTLPYLLATTADGQVQVWVSEDETIQVWDAPARRFISRFTGESEIKCCAIAPDGVTIVAGEQSGRLHFLYLEGT